MSSGKAKAVSVEKVQHTELGFANARGIRENGIEDWRQFARRGADDFQYFRGRGLALARLTEFAGQLGQVCPASCKGCVPNRRFARLGPSRAPTFLRLSALSAVALPSPRLRQGMVAAQRDRKAKLSRSASGMSALGHVWTAPWQELFDVAAALVGCGHVSGLFVRRVWPLALMLCADRVPIVSTHFKSAMTQTGSPDPRNDRVCITSSCPRQLVLPICLLASLTLPAAVRLLVSLAAHHDGPGHPCDLVGERNGGDLGGSALHQSCEPGPLGAVLSRISDNGHGAGDQQPSQVAIALLGDAAEPFLAAGRMLLRHQPDPGRKIAPRAERLPVADLGNQGGGHNRANAGDLLQPPAGFTRAMPGMDALVD